jgi:chromosome segregation ATPase
MSDIMLHGVLNMPPELWSDSLIDVMQRHSRYVQASQYINELDDKLTSAREEIAILKSKYADHHSEADRITYEIKTVTEQRDKAQAELDRGLRENQELWASNAELTEQRDRLAEEIMQLKSQLTQTRGAVTISRNGYVQELEQQRDRLAKAATTLIAAKGRHNTMLAYEGLRQSLQSLTTNTEQRDNVTNADEALQSLIKP